jgi:hypothetical protein
MWLPNCFTVPRHFSRLKIIRLRQAEAEAGLHAPEKGQKQEQGHIRVGEMDELLQQQQQQSEQQRVILMGERRKALQVHRRRLLHIYTQCYKL